MNINSVGSLGRQQAMRQGPPPKPEEKFNELDLDGSGSLNTEELGILAEHISEMTGADKTAEDLLAELDTDGNGSLEMSEMPPPPGGGEFRGPPPFMAEDGSIQNMETMNFNPLESLMSYLDSEEDGTTSESLSLTA
jgi:hypothetical protein